MKPIKPTVAAKVVKNVGSCDVNAKEIRLKDPVSQKLPPDCAPPDVYRAYALSNNELNELLEKCIGELKKGGEPREFYTDADGRIAW